MMKRGLQALALMWMHSALALGAGSLECTTAPGAARYSAWRADAARALARRGDARSLATAAALCFVASGTESASRAGGAQRRRGSRGSRQRA